MSSTPRRVPIGLPNNPRSSSRLAGPVAPSNHLEHRRAASSQLPSRPINSGMRRDPRPIAKADNRMDSSGRAYPVRHQQTEIRNPRLSGDSATTSSSSGSEGASFWARGNHSRASSRTTIHSDEDLDERYLDVKQESRSRAITPASSRTESGYVWNTVTEVANVLTQEVTRVWAAGLGTTDANFEEDDGHLTRVMRAYHLSKARSPSELPDWLFSARERGLGQGRFEANSHNNSQERASVAQQAEQERRKRGENHHSDFSMRTKNMNHRLPENGIATAQGKLSGTERLKQMRNLRQNGSAPSNRF